MNEYRYKVNQWVVENLVKFIQNGPNRDIEEEYQILLQHYPQIQNIVETHRHQDIRHIRTMQQQVWDELRHGDSVAFEFALEFCIEYMVENTMQEAKTILTPPPSQHNVPTTDPDEPTAGPTGGRFKTYRLRIR